MAARKEETSRLAEPRETTRKILDPILKEVPTNMLSEPIDVVSVDSSETTAATTGVLPPASTSDRSSKTFSEDLYKITSNLPQPKVVIIGAGIAGLTAAQHLVQSGMRNLTVIEASERYGGRIFTKQFGDVDYCELGTHYLDFNNDDQNKSKVEVPWLRDVAFVKSSGKWIESQETHDMLAMFEKIQMDMAQEKDVAEKNLYKTLVNRVESQLQSVPKEKRSTATRVFCGIMQNLRSNFGTDLVNVDAKISPKGLNRHSELMPLNGCANYLGPLVDVLPEDALRLGTPVGRIEWNLSKYKDHPIMVKTLTGDTFMADYAIVTLPLSVLKSLGSTLFYPPLPQSKVWSMSRMGVGTVEKIFLEFDEPIEGWFKKAFTMAVTPNEAHDKRSWTSGMSSVERVANSKKVLEITVAGRQAEDMRLMSDDQVANEAHSILQKFHRKSLPICLASS